MGSAGKKVGGFVSAVTRPAEGLIQGTGSFLGINAPTKLGGGGTFAITPEAAAAEQKAINYMTGKLTGETPLVSGEQYKQSLSDIIKQQQSAAASARGVSNVGLMQREAMMGGRMATSDLAQQAAIAKLQEQQAAAQGLAAITAAQRGVAQSAAASQLGAQQEASKTRAEFFGSLAGTGGKIFAAGQGAKNAAYGGEIPGKANVSGDSEENDTEPYMLSPGEIVIPRSAAKDRDSAMAFLDALKFRHEAEKEEKPGQERVSKGDYSEGMAKLLEEIKKLHEKLG